MDLLRFFQERSSVSIRRILFYAAIAGISNALILSVINAAAEHANEGAGASVRYLIMFLITLALYNYTQRYIFITTTVEVEKIIHNYRKNAVELIRHCDLDSLERIGRPLIFAGITRQPQVISQTAGPLVLAVQSIILIFFTTIYMAALSIWAFLLTILILAIAIYLYQRKMAETNRDLHDATVSENELFGSLTDAIEGFKEIRLNTPRSDDLADHISTTSARVTDLKTKVDTHFSVLFVFGQTTFYLLAAAMVFLLPTLGQSYSSELLKTTTVVLFLIGPISSVLGVISNMAQAKAAVESMVDLEEKLRVASKEARTIGDRRAAFDEIAFEGVVYDHNDDNGNPGFRVGPIDLTIRQGEVLFISGGNGSGKSTLLMLLTALYWPRSGSIRLDGRPVSEANREAYQSLFSTVFYDFHLFPRLYGMNDIDPGRVDELLREMEIRDKTRLVNGQFDTLRLSSGQRKRLALIVAMLEDRPICIFDEWAADQDPQFRRKFYEEIVPALKARGRTVIAVTHDDRYFAACDRRIAMEEGKIVLTENGNDYAR